MKSDSWYPDAQEKQCQHIYKPSVITNNYHLQRAHLNNNYNRKSLRLLGLYLSAKTRKLTNKLN